MIIIYIMFGFAFLAKAEPYNAWGGMPSADPILPDKGGEDIESEPRPFQNGSPCVPLDSRTWKCKFSLRGYPKGNFEIVETKILASNIAKVVGTLKIRSLIVTGYADGFPIEKKHWDSVDEYCRLNRVGEIGYDDFSAVKDCYGKINIEDIELSDVRDWKYVPLLCKKEMKGRISNVDLAIIRACRIQFHFEQVIGKRVQDGIVSKVRSSDKENESNGRNNVIAYETSKEKGGEYRGVGVDVIIMGDGDEWK